MIASEEAKKAITVIDAATGKIVKVCNEKEQVLKGVTLDDNGNVYAYLRSEEITAYQEVCRKSHA